MTPGLIVGGAQILGTAIDSVSQAIQNRKQRKYEGQVYDKQRRDALADFHMQNEYNSPTSQMARLREAGLNPNLVYGSGAAQQPAAQIRSVDQKVSQRQPLGIGRGLGESVNKYFDTRVQQLQADNLKAQNTVLVNKAALQGLEGAQIAGRTAFTAQQLINAKELKDASIEQMKMQQLKWKNDMDLGIRESDRRDIMQSQNIAESVSRIAKNKADMEMNPTRRAEMLARINQMTTNTELDRQLKQFEIDLNKMGMTKGDELWQRLVFKIGDELLKPGSIDRIIEAIKGIKLFPWQ